MIHPIAGVVAGSLAGLAGTAALNATTYLDQAVRGRPASRSPQETVSKLAGMADIDIPGDKEAASNRLDGAGALAGYAVGMGVGAAAGLLRSLHIKVPKAVAIAAVGLGVMVAADGAMTKLGITDPRSWTLETIAEDAIPHLAYGIVTVHTLHRLLDPTTPQVR